MSSFVLFSLIVILALSVNAGDYALVVNCYNAKLGKIDVATNALISELSVADSVGVPVPNVTNVVVDTIHNWAYVSDHVANGISIVDLNSWTTTGPITPSGMGKAPVGMALNKTCDRLYIGTYGVDGLEDSTDPLETYAISGTSFPPTLTKLGSVPVGKHPILVTLSQDEEYVLVTCRNQACFTVVNTTTNAVAFTRTYPSTSYEPEGVDMHPTANIAYVFSHGQNLIEVFDFDSLKVVNSVPISNATPPQPSGGALSPTGNRLLVCGQSAGKAFLFDTSDPRNPVQMPNAIVVGPQPHMPLFINDTIAYVPNTNNTQPIGSISIVSTGAVPANIGQVSGTFHGPLGMALVKSQGAPTQLPPLYLTYVSHNEENLMYLNDQAFFLQNREFVRQLATVIKSKNAMWNFQSDWTFLKGVAKFDTGSARANTNGKNIVRWLVEDMGFEADPHAHESQYNYADVAYLHTQIGVTPSLNVGGFLYSPPDNTQGWEQHEAGEFGVNYPSHFWKPDNLWGAATYLHQGDDDFSSGAWKPQDRYNFYLHDSSKNLAYISVGCGYYKTLVDAIANHAVPDTGFYTLTMFIPQFDLNAQKIQVISDQIDSIAPYVAQGKVVWSSLTNTGNVWRTVHRSRPSRVDCTALQPNCCQGTTGNVNGNGIVDLSDLSMLVSYLIGGGGALSCTWEANVNNVGIVDLGDLSALVSYLTGGGYVLPNCAG